MGDLSTSVASLFAGMVPTDADLTSVADLLDALTSATVPYTPAWTGAGGNPAIGNGFIFGQYTRADKLGIAYVSISMGTTTTFGSGAWSIGLPAGWTAAAFGLIRMAGPGFARDNSGATHSALELVLASGGTSCDIRAQSGNQVSSTVPFTWASGDYLHGLMVVDLA